MDFDSLSILKNNNGNAIKNNYSTVADFNNIHKTVETKVSDEKVKVNQSDLRKFDSNKKQGNNSEVLQEATNEAVYKGEYIETVENAVKLANERLKEVANRRFSYAIHEKTQRIMITIKDSNDNVIKEIPSEESLDFFAKLQEFSGLFIDKKS